MMSTQRLNELHEKLSACGMTAWQIESYIKYLQAASADRKDDSEIPLPSDEQFATLAQAQKVYILEAGKSRWVMEYDGYWIHRFLQIPRTQWQSARAAIEACFGMTSEELDELYDSDEDWLFVTADDVRALGAYLKPLSDDPAVLRRIFFKAALLGTEPARSRIDAVIGLLGEEIGKKLIAVDAAGYGWLFYRFYSDPVGAIAYMLECGMSPERILDTIEQESIILYLFKEGRNASYCHSQEIIDELIRQYMQ